MNTYLYTLRRQLKYALPITIISLILWTFTLSFYPLFKENKENVINLLNNLPDRFRIALGINYDTLFTPLGYYSLFFIILAILSSILSIVLGLDLVSYERTLSYKENIAYVPCDKKKIFTSKLLSSITYLLIHFISLNIVSFIVLTIIKDLAFSKYLLFLINFSLLLLELVFLSIGTLIGCFIKKRKFTLITFITVLVFIGLSLLENAFNLTFLKYINPYSYFEVADIVSEERFQTRFLVISVFIFFFFIFFAYGIYEHEDVKEDNKKEI